VHGVQCRFIIYKKELEGEIDIKSPKELGGLTSDSYKALNPLAKMPLLVLPGGTALPESEVRAHRPAPRRAARRAERPSRTATGAAAAEQLCLRPTPAIMHAPLQERRACPAARWAPADAPRAAPGYRAVPGGEVQGTRARHAAGRAGACRARVAHLPCPRRVHIGRPGARSRPGRISLA